jgi:hypothetical protein
LSQKLVFPLNGVNDDKGISFIQGAGSVNRAGYIDYIGAGNWTGSLVFGVNAVTSDSPAVQIMEVQPNGVNIGSNSEPAASLTVNDTVTTGQATLLTLENNGNNGNAAKIVFQTDAGSTGAGIVSQRVGSGYQNDLFSQRMEVSSAFASPTPAMSALERSVENRPRSSW